MTYTGLATLYYLQRSTAANKTIFHTNKLYHILILIFIQMSTFDCSSVNPYAKQDLHQIMTVSHMFKESVFQNGAVNWQQASHKTLNVETNYPSTAIIASNTD